MTAHQRKFGAASRACKGLGKAGRKACMRSKMRGHSGGHKRKSRR